MMINLIDACCASCVGIVGVGDHLPWCKSLMCTLQKKEKGNNKESNFLVVLSAALVDGIRENQNTLLTNFIGHWGCWLDVNY